MGLEEAFYSERFVSLRRRHLENNLEGTLCYNCVNNKLAPIEPLNNALHTPVTLDFFKASTKRAPVKVKTKN